MDGRKFRRQHPIGRYIVDFVCLQSRLVIEIDGDSHAHDARQALDEQRDTFLAKLGFRVLRFGNHNVVTNLNGVAEAIWMELQPGDPSLRPSPQPSPRGGEGGFRLWGEGDSVA
jgi:very-short-patch-repair endonuclease